MYIIAAITPVFIIIILGKALQVAAFFRIFLAELNRLVYYVALPLYSSAVFLKPHSMENDLKYDLFFYWHTG